jgi:hypothetical protein
MDASFGKSGDSLQLILQASIVHISLSSHTCFLHLLLPRRCSLYEYSTQHVSPAVSRTSPRQAVPSPCTPSSMGSCHEVEFSGRRRPNHLPDPPQMQREHGEKPACRDTRRRLTTLHGFSLVLGVQACLAPSRRQHVAVLGRLHDWRFLLHVVPASILPRHGH